MNQRSQSYLVFDISFLKDLHQLHVTFTNINGLFVELLLNTFLHPPRYITIPERYNLWPKRIWYLHSLPIIAHSSDFLFIKIQKKLQILVRIYNVKLNH